MNIFLVWPDRALSVYIKDVACCVPGLRLVLSSSWLLNMKCLVILK